MKIPFNRFHLTGKEVTYLQEVVQTDRISGDGLFTKRCNQFLEEKFNFKKVFLTTSCTHSLEIAALLAGIEPGDEVILPSYTFVSTANAFMLRGAKIVFADSNPDNPNLDVAMLERHITDKTKAVVPIHYAGIACDMDQLKALAQQYDFWIIEDAAQALNAYHKDQPLGSIGEVGCFSFHDTKNITCGEGGLLAINQPELRQKAEIIREKGTNRAAFYRGEIDKYGWVDVGSSYLPSDLLAAFLLAQLESLEAIQTKRMQLWDNYFQELSYLEQRGDVRLPCIPDYAKHNAHIFYLVCPNGEVRDNLMYFLRENDIQAPFHYLSLHQSSFYKDKYVGPPLPYSDHYTDCLIRLPLFYDLTMEEQAEVVNKIKVFFG